jgi:hypothetical protein
MKVLARSKQGNMLKIEDATRPKGYQWYFLDPTILKFAESINNGDDIEIKSEDKAGQLTITYVTKTGTAAVTSTPSTKPTYGKSPQEQESIKRMSIMKTAADAYSRAMQGQIGDLNVLSSSIISLYNVLMAEVNKGL